MRANKNSVLQKAGPNGARKVRDLDMSTMSMSTLYMSEVAWLWEEDKDKDGTEEEGIFVAETGGRDEVQRYSQRSSSWT